MRVFENENTVGLCIAPAPPAIAPLNLIDIATLSVFSTSIERFLNISIAWGASLSKSMP